MRRRSLAAVMCFIVLVAISPGGFSQNNRPCPVATPVSDAKFAPGQVWSFRSRDFEPDATVTILKIESLPKIGEIVHVKIDGIRLRNCSGGPEPTSIEHAPFTRDAIERSAIKLLRTGAVPAFEDGYNYWKDHCGGVYTIPVSEMVIVDEKTFKSNSGCST
ncbi:MAG: hypothetical protein WBY53_03710 [Acidobacteriaceae bacterium]